MFIFIFWYKYMLQWSKYFSLSSSPLRVFATKLNLNFIYKHNSVMPSTSIKLVILWSLTRRSNQLIYAITKRVTGHCFLSDHFSSIEREILWIDPSEQLKLVGDKELGLRLTVFKCLVILSVMKFLIIIMFSIIFKIPRSTSYLSISNAKYWDRTEI